MKLWKNESNLVINHYSIYWINFIDMNDDGLDKPMIDKNVDE